MISLCLLWMGWFLSAKSRRQAEQLYREYHPVLRRRCQRIIRDDATVDDAMQEIFWTICRKHEAYRGEPAEILPWLYRVTTTHCLKMIEKNKRWQRNVEEAITEGMDRYDTCFSPDEMETKLTIHRVLEKMPPRQRQAVVYRFVSGMTQQEIADVMEVTRDQVRTWLNQYQERGKRMLNHSIDTVSNQKLS